MKPLRTILTLCLLLMTSILAWAEEPLRFGITTYRPTAQTDVQWQPIAAYLESALGRNIQFRFHAVEDLENALTRNELDVVITNPGQAILLQHRGLLTMPLATLVRQEGSHELATNGGVIFSRADTDNLSTDLSSFVNKRKRIAAASVKETPNKSRCPRDVYGIMRV